MVDADAYLLELAAYIHLNPVRTHIPERPESHHWSSYRADKKLTYKIMLPGEPAMSVNNRYN